MAFPADSAGVVTVGVASLADAGMVTVGVTDLADAVSLASPIDIVDGPEYSGGVISWGDRLSPGVWCRERTQIQNDLDCQYVNYVSCDPVGMGCTVPADGCTGSFGTLLSGPLCPVTDYMTYWEKPWVATLMTMMRGLAVNPAPLITMPQGIMSKWCDWNDVDVEEGYYDPFQPDVEGRFVSPWDAFGMDTDTVVVASVMCEAKNVDLQISELPGLYGDIGSMCTGQDLGRPFRSLETCWLCQTCGVSLMLDQRGPRQCPVIRRTRRSPLLWLIPGRVCPSRSSQIS